MSFLFTCFRVLGECGGQRHRNRMFPLLTDWEQCECSTSWPVKTHLEHYWLHIFRHFANQSLELFSVFCRRWGERTWNSESDEVLLTIGSIQLTVITLAICQKRLDQLHQTWSCEAWDAPTSFRDGFWLSEADPINFNPFPPLWQQTGSGVLEWFSLWQTCFLDGLDWPS